MSESRSSFTLILESKSLRMVQNMDSHNFTLIMGVSGNQIWSIIDRPVKRRIFRKTIWSRMIGIDDESYRKGY